jgi:TM2 domain-containing membrane protein YozV
MSEDKKDLGDELNDMLGDAKEGAKKAAEKIKEDAKDFSKSAKETAGDFKEGISSVTGGDNKKVVAGILAIILGSLGIHKFVLGYTKEGVILLLVTVLSCGFGSAITGLIGLIEGIIYLTKTDEEFYNTYQANQKPWF